MINSSNRKQLVDDIFLNTHNKLIKQIVKSLDEEGRFYDDLYQQSYLIILNKSRFLDKSKINLPSSFLLKYLKAELTEYKMYLQSSLSIPKFGKKQRDIKPYFTSSIDFKQDEKDRNWELPYLENKDQNFDLQIEAALVNKILDNPRVEPYRDILCKRFGLRGYRPHFQKELTTEKLDNPRKVCNACHTGLNRLRKVILNSDLYSSILIDKYDLTKTGIEFKIKKGDI